MHCKWWFASYECITVNTALLDLDLSMVITRVSNSSFHTLFLQNDRLLTWWWPVMSMGSVKIFWKRAWSKIWPTFHIAHSNLHHICLTGHVWHSEMHVMIAFESDTSPCCFSDHWMEYLDNFFFIIVNFRKIFCQIFWFLDFRKIGITDHDDDNVPSTGIKKSLVWYISTRWLSLQFYVSLRPHFCNLICCHGNRSKRSNP